MTTPVLFEELPASTRKPAGETLRHSDTAEILKVNQGQWARIQERAKRGDAASAAYQIRNGALAAFRPAGSFDARSRSIGGRFYVYACYVGIPELSGGSHG